MYLSNSGTTKLSRK